jgi:putative aldouronate transport system permease protein
MFNRERLGGFMKFRKRQGSDPYRVDQKSLLDRMLKYRYFYLMFIPIILYYLIFQYIPMYGINIAFYNMGIFGNKTFVGWDNFNRLFSSANFWIVFNNTLILSGLNLVSGMIGSIILALLLNEVKNVGFKKVVQTVVFLPHFISWVVVASIFTMVLSPDYGLVNAVIQKLGGKPIYFLVSQQWWRAVFLSITLWKGIGWGAIVYLAALSGVDPQLYEAASMDGAGRLKQTWFVTLPAIRNTIFIVLIMQLSTVLNLFYSVFVLMNPLVYPVADVLGTYTYRVGLLQADYSYSTAVGLFTSLISMVLVLGANGLSKKVNGESVI